MNDRRYRRPESVLVVVYTRERQALLLRRRQPAGYWQSVTGGLRWGETAVDAAIREVREEIGIHASYGLTDTGHTNRYPPLPEFQHKFGPNVRENTEYVWTLELTQACAIVLNLKEHDQFQWISLSDAASIRNASRFV